MDTRSGKAGTGDIIVAKCRNNTSHCVFKVKRVNFWSLTIEVLYKTCKHLVACRSWYGESTRLRVIYKKKPRERANIEIDVSA